MFQLTIGEIEIGDERISVGYTKDDLLASALYTQVIRETTNAYSLYVLSPQRIKNERFSVFLSFNPEGMLEFISLSILPEQTLPSWESWSKESEIKRKKLNDEWLKKQIGLPPFKYEWGEIVSQFDPRSGSSAIIIRYFY
jgi:hypothetical protein